jgi:hypothetical protein
VQNGVSPRAFMSTSVATESQQESAGSKAYGSDQIQVKKYINTSHCLVICKQWMLCYNEGLKSCVLICLGVERIRACEEKARDVHWKYRTTWFAPFGDFYCDLSFVIVDAIFYFAQFILGKLETIFFFFFLSVLLNRFMRY